MTPTSRTSFAAVHEFGVGTERSSRQSPLTSAVEGRPAVPSRGRDFSLLPADLHKLLEWLDRASPLLEAQIVAAGLNHTLDKALMRNFAEMNLREATVSITARGRDALSKSLVMHPRTGPRTAALPISERFRSAPRTG